MTKDKTSRTAETSIQSSAAVDDHSKSSTDAARTDKLKDATQTHGVISSEPKSDKSESHVIQLNNCTCCNTLL